MAHHEPLKALGPIDWSELSHDDLKPFLTSTFFQAQTVVDSIPTPPSQARLALPGRARSHTDSSILPQPSSSPSSPNRPGREHANTTANENAAAAAAAAAHAVALRKEWKEVKVPPKDNPMGIAVYKLPAKDGRGAWFARRSLHEGVAFDKFQLGLEREFAETMRNNTGPGTGNVRGIGAEKRAEHLVCDGVGKAEAWLLSAQFPGPTTPRDFVTLLLTGNAGGGEEEGKRTATKRRGEPRQYMVVSKPCGHPECAPRTGYIRGSYESVEIIREVPLDKPLRRTRSSVDLRRDELQLPIRTEGAGDKLAREAMLRSASDLPQDDTAADLPRPGTEMAVEWIMVTRSDPGGSVPRFMVEKGTPGGIVNDAGRFMKWLESKGAGDFEDSGDNNFKEEAMKSEAPVAALAAQGQMSTPAPRQPQARTTTTTFNEEEVPPSGLYSIITGVIGAASSAVASRLPAFPYASEAGTDPETAVGDDSSDSDSDGSERSFASAPEPEERGVEDATATPLAEKTMSRGDLTSLHSGKSEESGATKAAAASTAQHEKQLRKLQDRYRKLEEKMARQQKSKGEGQQQQQQEDGGNNEALAKLREKHEREVARQEENYRKELKKLEEKRLKEERKAEERRRKEREKEARGNLTMELERTQVQRDMALKQIDILKGQVGELQAQNTLLVARLGKLEGAEAAVAALSENGRASGEEKKQKQGSAASSLKSK